MATRCAWTLVEALIAMAIGLVIAFTAASALRAASQASATANRLSLENGLMRGAFHAALEEADFWTAFDDPARPDALRHLHGVSSDNKGLPFTPFAQTMADAVFADRPSEDDRGWNPDDPWLPNDPRTWWRVNQGERDISDVRFGRYAILSNADAPRGGAPLTIASNAAVGAYGAVVVPHAWLPAQMRALMNALGYYGLIDYLPSNAILGWHQAYREGPDPEIATNAGGIPQTLIRFPNFNDPYRFNGTDNLRTPTGVEMITAVGRFSVLDADHFLPASAATTPAQTDGLVKESRRYFWYGSDAWRDETEHSAAMLALRPSHWPEVTLRVDRSAGFSSYAPLCTIVRADPVTGERRELWFSVTATTLRGARQQRARDGGWARWDDAPGYRPDPDLDAPAAPWSPKAHP